MELYSAIRFILTDGAVQRFGARTPGGGLELWCRLKGELQGAAPEVAMVKQQRYLYPARAANLAVLWDRLEEWRLLGEEVEAELGTPMPDAVRACALRQLLPTELATDLATRPELRGFGPALAWVRNRLSHQRALTQAAAAAKGADDMHAGNLNSSAADWAAFQEWQQLQQQDWPAEPLVWQAAPQYLGAFQKGKGKGGKAGKGGGGGLPYQQSPGPKGNGGKAGGGKAGGGGGKAPSGP